MKPHRIRMTNALLVNYGLYKKMDIYVSGQHAGAQLGAHGCARARLETTPCRQRGPDKVSLG